MSKAKRRAQQRPQASTPVVVPTTRSQGAQRASRWLVAGLSVIAAALVLGGIALTNRFGSAGVASEPTAPPRAPVTARPGGETPASADQQLAPDFSAKVLGGGTFTLAEQRGKPVLILFSASWCLPCIGEVNKMASLHEMYGSRRLRQLVLSIDPEDTESEFDGLRRKTRGGNLVWALDVRQQALRAYRIRAVDTKVLVDQEGRIVFSSIGITPFETLRDAVAKTLP